MKLTLTLTEDELSASIANGSLLAFIANAGIEREIKDETLTKDEVRDILMKAQKVDADAVVEKIKANGGKLSDIPEEKYQELYDWAEELIKG